MSRELAAGAAVGNGVGDGVGGSGRSKSSMVKFLRPPSVVGDGVGLGVIEGELALVSRGTNSANAATLMLKSEELIMELVMNIVMLSRVSAASWLSTGVQVSCSGSHQYAFSVPSTSVPESPVPCTSNNLLPPVEGCAEEDTYLFCTCTGMTIMK
jgi:hypothetical protein